MEPISDGKMIARSIRFLGLCLIRAALILAFKPPNYEDAIKQTIKECGPLNID